METVVTTSTLELLPTSKQDDAGTIQTVTVNAVDQSVEVQSKQQTQQEVNQTGQNSDQFSFCNITAPEIGLNYGPSIAVTTYGYSETATAGTGLPQDTSLINSNVALDSLVSNHTVQSIMPPPPPVTLTENIASSLTNPLQTLESGQVQSVTESLMLQSEQAALSTTSNITVTNPSSVMTSVESAQLSTGPASISPVQLPDFRTINPIIPSTGDTVTTQTHQAAATVSAAAVVTVPATNEGSLPVQQELSSLPSQSISTGLDMGLSVGNSGFTPVQTEPQPPPPPPSYAEAVLPQITTPSTLVGQEITHAFVGTSTTATVSDPPVTTQADIMATCAGTKEIAAQVPASFENLNLPAVKDEKGNINTAEDAASASLDKLEPTITLTDLTSLSETSAAIDKIAPEPVPPTQTQAANPQPGELVSVTNTQSSYSLLSQPAAPFVPNPLDTASVTLDNTMLSEMPSAPSAQLVSSTTMPSVQSHALITPTPDTPSTTESQVSASNISISPTELPGTDPVSQLLQPSVDTQPELTTLMPPSAQTLQSNIGPVDLPPAQNVLQSPQPPQTLVPQNATLEIPSNATVTRSPSLHSIDSRISDPLTPGSPVKRIDSRMSQDDLTSATAPVTEPGPSLAPVTLPPAAAGQSVISQILGTNEASQLQKTDCLIVKTEPNQIVTSPVNINLNVAQTTVSAVPPPTNQQVTTIGQAVPLPEVGLSTAIPVCVIASTNNIVVPKPTERIRYLMPPKKTKFDFRSLNSDPTPINPSIVSLPPLQQPSSRNDPPYHFKTPAPPPSDINRQPNSLFVTGQSQNQAPLSAPLPGSTTVTNAGSQFVQPAITTVVPILVSGIHPVTIEAPLPLIKQEKYRSLGGAPVPTSVINTVAASNIPGVFQVVRPDMQNYIRSSNPNISVMASSGNLAASRIITGPQQRTNIASTTLTTASHMNVASFPSAPSVASSIPHLIRGPMIGGAPTGPLSGAQVSSVPVSVVTSGHTENHHQQQQQQRPHKKGRKPGSQSSTSKLPLQPLMSGDPAKPYQCPLCNKHLASKNVFQLHLRSHTGEKPFSCTLCDHRFSQKTSLTRHMRSHTGDRPYPCQTCGKRFADKERIKIHMRTHTGEKPFACSVCQKQFSQKSTVKRHMSVHTGEKPFKCTQCGKGFANRGNLTAHMKTHAAR